MSGLTCIGVSLGAVFLCLSYCPTTGSGLQASFYGDSYVGVPVQDASSSTDIKLQFRTSSPNGLLMLVAGTTDYCKVLLQSGAIQATLDLGSGEATLVSPPGLLFNDLQWHSVHLSRVQSRVTFTVDGIYSSEAVTPGRFFELNIDSNVFVGGTGAFDGVAFFGNFRSFRGCLRNVSFNGVDVLKAGHEQSHSLYVYAVTWDCAAEFGATSDQTISFTRTTSYIAFPSLETRQEGRVTFDLRTRSEHALVVYNSGTLVDSDFIAVEIVNRRLKLRVNKGSGSVALTTDWVVNDGRWHQVEVVVDAISARITVDGQRKEERINFGNTRFLDVTTHLYVGGVGVVARAVAVQRELDSLNGTRAAGGSLIGCIQNFKVDGRLLGFREAVNSRDIQPECAWGFPCAFRPCADDAECIEEGFYDYRCQCWHSECYLNDSDSIGGEGGVRMPLHPSTSAQDMLRVQDVVVKEGGRSLLSSNNIDFIDGERNVYGIPDSSVSFKVLDYPDYGEILVDAGRRSSSRPVTFTMADLKQNKVWYNHDGSETFSDRIVLQLEFLSLQSSTPDAFQKTYRFTLMIQVAAWNDPPEIHLPPDNTLVLITSTQINITPRLINATDTDDPPSSLEYTVLYQQGFDVGFFELNDNLGPRARITRFTQEDIDDGKLSYVHRGLQYQQLRLQVSDGKDIGDPKILKVSAVPLTISLVANTGLVVPRGSSRTLTRENLTYTTNAPDQDIEVRYVITDLPYDGEIQRQQYADNSWVVKSTFTQKHVDCRRVRYVHNGTSKAEADYFNFKVTAMGVEMQQFEFHIRIVNLTVELMRSVGLTLRGIKERILTSDELKAVSAVPDHGPSDVVFSILSLPSYGQLMRSERKGANRIQKRRLAVGSNFTQTDINDKLISYKLLRTLTERTIDDFEFVVHIPGFTSKATTQFHFVFEPAAEGELLVLNNGLMDVVEGESKPITCEDLFVNMRNYDDFGYLITDGPHHGVVQLVISNETRQTVTTFTNDDIKNGRVFYKHDDSETGEDFFSFTALFERSDPAIDEVSGIFNVKILLKNDNEPRRVINKTFFVVANRGRVITLDDIQYIDQDVDFDSSNLTYEWREIPNGNVIFREASLKNFTLNKFQQKDIADGRIYFKHNGANYSKSLITVSDGYHFTSNLQEVQAGDPFVKVSVDRVLFVNCGQRAVLLASTFGVETNLDVSDRDIRFTVLEPPSRGLLKLGDKDGQHFTLADVKNHLVVYEHDASESSGDDFGFKVKVDNLVVLGRTAIRVTQTINRLAVVEEFESVTITEQLLSVGNSQTAPGNITYLVTSQPKYGFLTLVNRREVAEHLLTFTQNDVNLGRLKYEHGEEGQYADAFNFDVHLDNISLTGQTFRLEILSTRGSIPFQLGNLTVLEGSSAYLTKDLLIFKSKTFDNRDIDFIVLREPMNGRLQNVDVPLYPVIQFTLEHVRNRKILYIHDGSETDSDRLLLVAKMNSNTGRHSSPKMLRITVQPKNDAPPRVTINEKLRVWQGSKAPIKRTSLLSEDDDTRPEDLTYLISQPTNGDVIILESRSSDISVMNFTQADINNNLVVFLHRVSTESSMGYFRFNVSDGVNFLSKETFHIEVEPLLLTLQVSDPLGVFPGLAQPLTNSVLRATTNDPLQPRPISYTLQSLPSYGRLVTSDLAEEVSTFSQEEIDAGAIYYRHNITTFAGHSLEDSITFDVSTAYASAIRSQTLIFCVSYESLNSDNLDQFVVVQGTSVDEGEAVEISKTSLDVTRYKKRLVASGLRGPEVYFVVHELPTRGNLTLSGENLQPGDNFTQKEINHGLIVYQHDHTDTLFDAFSFTVSAELPGKQFLRSSCALPPLVVTYNITIRPVNDHPFTFHTDSPSMELIQGSVCTITNLMLKTTDPDTDPDDIKYEINNMPNNGLITLSQSPRAAVATVYAFSQRDVDSNSVVFVHDGTAGNGAFYFSVSDGRHKPLFKVFNIRVTPLNLEVVRLTDAEILQGHFSTVVTATNIVLRTNARSEQITYNVTKVPIYGLIYVNDVISGHFSHKNVEEGLVGYVQTDFSSANDSFEFLVSDNVQNVVFNQRLSVVVKPYLKMSDRPLQAKDQRSVGITIKDLDATELSIVTGSNPVYYVIQGPTRGRLVLIDSVKGARREVKARKGKSKEAVKSANGRDRTRSSYAENAIFRFTHDDVVNEKVEYRIAEAPGTSAANDGQTPQDSFSFVLTAHNAQPVTGTLRIDVIPSPKISSGDESTGRGNPVIPELRSISRSLAKTTTIAATVGVGAKDSAEEPPEKVNKNLLIVFLISGITVMALVGFVVFKCIRRKKTKRYDSSSAKKSEVNASANAAAPAVPAIAITSSSSPNPIKIHPQRPTQFPSNAEGEVFNLSHPISPKGRHPSKLERQEALIADSPPSSPSTTSRTGYVRVVSAQKDPVTPDEQTTTTTPGGTIKKEQVIFDWENVDPELLQHCRKTNPILHKNQYWV